MNIIFGLALDGYEPVEPASLLDCIRCGPLGLIQILETRLGLKSKSMSAAQRVKQYRALLETQTKERAVFYGASFEKDSYAVAETLLRWRDDLIEAGWDGRASSDDSKRLRDFAALEARTGESLFAGQADRLKSIVLELACRSPNINSLTVLDERQHLPVLWQQVCDKLAANFAPADSTFRADISPSITDLGKLQTLLKASGDRQIQKVAFSGDGSLVCLNAHSEFTLARGIAQWLVDLRRASAETTLIADSSAGVLDQAFLALNEPAMGLQPPSTARPIPQVLLLALRLHWQPLDPRALLEFLTHPACPVTGFLRSRLAKAVGESPGIGGPKWQAAVEAAKESAKRKHKDAPASLKDALRRIDDDLHNWLRVPRFDPAEGATGAAISECCARVTRWAAVRAAVSGMTDSEVDQFNALAALGSELSELLCSVPTITRCQLERLLHLVNSSGWLDGSMLPELGRVHRVASPAALIESVDTVVWWNFSEPSAPQRLPWTQAELKQLVAHSAQFPAAEAVAARENAVWLRPLFAARKKLILVWPHQRAGETVARHPLHARLLSVVEGESPSVPTIDLDRDLLRNKASPPILFARIDHRPLPKLRRWWKVSSPKLLEPRDQESYSSAEKFIYSPYAWVLGYRARLHAGALATLRVEDNRQKGTLLHRLQDLLLLAPAKDIDWRIVSERDLGLWIDRQWTPLLEREGASLLLPGKRADAAALLATSKLALWELLVLFRGAKVVSARTNVELTSAKFIGGSMGGVLDLLVESSKNRTAVVDLKFGGFKVHEKELKDNRTLQLAVYGYLLSQQGHGKWPDAAFYILTDRRLIARDAGFFPGARVVASGGSGGSIATCWSDFEKMWGWRRKQLDGGWIEITVPNTEPTTKSKDTQDSTPPLANWLATEDNAKFNVYDALTGWGADA